ncbi:two-component system sensor histidine kinase NtrB [Paraburkholderia strydomiana]|uniref:histidine kinase n=1 Tax=Paraburkholderia strydomiana TaxID=1245417 RepID=A0ABW9CA41_9BURK
MTIFYAIVVAVMLIAFLTFQHLRRTHVRRVSEKPDVGLPLDIGYSRRTDESHAFAAQGDTKSAGGPAKHATAGELASAGSVWASTRLAGSAHFFMRSAGRLRRTTARNGPPESPEEFRADCAHDEQFRGTLELLPFAILMTNQQGRIVLANAVAEKLFGYSQDELIGAALDMLVPALLAQFDGARLADISSRPLVRAIGGARDAVARRKDSTEFPAEITANPVMSESGPHTLTVVVDRTEHYELQRNLQQLAHLTRVSALGELAGSLAHELNQPLTAILSNAQAAQRFMATQPINVTEVREILHDLVEDNHRASEVIRKIRTLVKKGELEAAPLSIESVIEDVALLVHSDAVVRGIQVLLDIAPDLPPARGDRVQLQQVVLNLLLNAFDALESRPSPGRVVTVEAKLDGKDMICVAVRDNGSGVPRNTFDKLFMPFFTSKREGLGLGLSISRSIVDTHGGRIWAQNNQDRGASFCFTLPAEATAERNFPRGQP